MRRTKLSLALFAASLASLISAGQAHAAFPGENGPIAISVGHQDPLQEDIWLFGEEGEKLLELTSDINDDTRPDISRDGTWVVWQREADPEARIDEIWKARTDGTQMQRVFGLPDRNSGSPSFSPDGEWIVFAVQGEGGVGFDVWRVRSDGTSPQQLTDTGAIFDVSPVYTPDGSKIIFESDRNDAGNFFADGEIMSMDPNGSNQQFLTQDNTNQRKPDVSPDGSTILFESDSGLAEMPIGGGAASPVLNASVFGPDSLTFEPVYSPDGLRILFELDDDATGQASIWRANADGSNPSELLGGVPGVMTYDDPTWGPLSDTEVLDPDMTAPKKLKVGGKKVKVKVKGGAGEQVTGVAKGKIKVKKGKKKRTVVSARSFKLKKVTKTTEAGKQTVYRLKLRKKKDNKKVLKLLKKGKDLRANPSIRFTDVAGNVATERRVVRLKAKKK